MKISRAFVAFAVAPMAMLAATPAYADGDVSCKAGPQDKWKPIAQVKKKAWIEGWTVLKTLVQGDCYEVYARTETGQVVEAFYHPVTLQKLIVYRRGQEIFRAPGFNPQ